ncbi:hypothetical protein PR048_009409 [Dryococelus australis]|uniref:Uncharacterized protein n=1 Tax=Dryococelus australis TaxID=614101 RepID=A0ABQ9HZU1_9NEOP|nr:hypothetical protein PR048_009409 [Dryococelus australis]
MVLSPQSVRYEPWRKSLYPITFRIYIFNWTNPEEFRSGGKPRLVEMGPYTYRFVRNHTLSLYYQQAVSNGNNAH